MGDLPKGADVPPLSKPLLKAQEQMLKAAVNDKLDVPVAVKPAAAGGLVLGAPAPSRKTMSKAEKKVADRTVRVSAPSPAGVLLPETMKDEQKNEKSSTPLLNENDARCYAARFNDLKGNTGLTHYATVGVPQGRLGTCAKSLTDYEAETYLETFPELA